jgi:cytochrome P450
MASIGKIDGLTNDANGAGLFFEWLNADWRGLFAELRLRRPILDIPPFLVVTRWSDVVDTLSRSWTFQVPYRPKMDPSVGPFMLGRDDSELNWRDKSVMSALLRFDDLPGIRDFAGRTAAAALAGRADPFSVDIARTVSRLVPLRVIQHCFGFPGPDDATMLRWSKAAQADMFHNLPGDPAIHSANVAAGTEMQAWVRGFLAQRQPWSSLTGDDTVSRLLRLTAGGLSGLDLQAVVSNVCGLLVGGIETTSQAIINATEQILLRPDVAARAVAAAVANDTTILDAIVWEALRFNPMTTLIIRVAGEAATLAPGSDHETPVAAGRTIAVAVGSAMFDAGVFTAPDCFKDRPRDAYLHMGFGSHECLGQYVAFAIIPETIRQILMLPGIHLLPDGASRIDVEAGAFAERFVLGLGLNEFAINAIVGCTAGRPYPFSLWSPDAAKPVEKYVSWTGLVDRSYTGRHLPPADENDIAALPPVAEVVELFRRQKIDGGEKLEKCARSSALFCFFAQWFTDSFLRTDPKDRRKNTSNHEIDLCQIYGLDAATAGLLRTGSGGRLRMEPRIPFPEHLYEDKRIKKHFMALPYVAGNQAAFEKALKELFAPAITDSARCKALYASGLERGNSTIFYAAISTVFIREHNRICAELAKRYQWDDDRLFETARNINIVLLLRIIVEEYINHLAGTPDFKFSLQRDFAERQRWYRTNRISLEFNLLYRWHSLTPDTLMLDRRLLQADEFRFNNSVLESKGAELVIDQASRQFAGRIGLGNSPRFLIEADKKALEMGRDYRLKSYNSYRQCFGMPPCKSYDELTGCPELSAKLRALYGEDNIDKVELLVGLLAEQRPQGAILSSLMRTMVGVDAFSQALTNPLLSSNVYGEDAFSEVGLGIIDATKTFKDIVGRNKAPGRQVGYVSFDVTQIPDADRL